MQQSLQELDSFRTYVNAISRIPVLTAEQEYELARRWRDKSDEEAARQLVVSNLRFVVKVAQEYRGYRLRMADIVQEGNLGLMRAVDRFDPDRGVKLISYAVWWIRAEIQAFILRTWSMVKFGTTRAQRRLFFGMHKARREIARLGMAQADKEIENLANQLGTTRKKVAAALQRMNDRDVSLEGTVHDDDRPLVATLPALDPPQDEMVERSRMREAVSERLRAVMPKLKERERYILEHRFLSDEPLLLREIAEKFGVSRERIRQCETQLKRKLRTVLADLEPAALEAESGPELRAS